jgi:hypothetical protein
MATDTTPAIVSGVTKTTDRQADMHPGDWKTKPYQINPISMFPFTAYHDMTGSSRTVGDNKFNFATQPYNGQFGTITDVYTNAALSSAYASGGVSGDPLFLKVTTATADNIRPQDTLLAYATATGGMVRADVLSVDVFDGTYSKVAIQLTEADTGNNLAQSALTFTLTGDSQPEKHALPDGKYEEAFWRYNYTQIYTEAAEWTKREMNTTERLAGNVRERAIQQMHKRFNIKREYSRFFGARDLKTGSGGKRTFTGGLLWWLQQEYPANIINFVTDTTFNENLSAPFRTGGYQFIRNVSVQIAQLLGDNYGTPAHVYCGDLALEAIQSSIKANTDQNVPQVTTGKFGMRVMDLMNLPQQWKLIMHPLFAINPMLRRTMIVTQPTLSRGVTMKGGGLEMIPAAYGKNENGHNYRSYYKTGLVVDEGFEMDNISTFAMITGVGLDSTAS